MSAVRVVAIVIFVIGAALGFFVYSSNGPDARFPFRLGLDLAGGSHLVYHADTSKVPEGEVRAAMASLREVVERRVNIFGVSEPLVQTEETFSGANRLVVELPGVSNLEEAARLIGETPALEFMLGTLDEAGAISYADTGLTGRFVARAQLNFTAASATGIAEPVVVLTFNNEGAELFERITRDHVGETLGIFLDGAPISLPVIREAIPGGTATISGAFTPDEARELVRGLNFGALPVPIDLISSSSIGPALGGETLQLGMSAGVIGVMMVMVFMVVWYRVPGVVAVVALSFYILLVLALFKLIPVTLTAAGIAAFILSIGMAVDANILIFERMKEELMAGNSLDDAIRQGFTRAWPSIRDSNLSSLISAAVLFWFGTALIKGFALVFAIGVLASMLSAITVSRTLTTALAFSGTRERAKLLFGSGFKI